MAKRGGGYNPAILATPVIFDNQGLAFPDLPEAALVVGDGNHRRALAQREERMNDEFIATVHRGLTRQEVFARKTGINEQRTIKPAERFIYAAEQGDVTAVNITNAVEGLGWEITYERAPGGLSCTNELTWIWERNHGAVVGAIRSYEEIWGRRDQRAQARVIKGLGAFWIRYPKADMERLVGAMRRAQLSVDELYEAGRHENEILPALKGVWDGVRYVLATTYNKGLRKRTEVLTVP